jgi:hypothetical protein
VARIAAGDESLLDLIRCLVQVSEDGLGLMFRDDEQTYAYTRKRPSDKEEPVLSGKSHRYGAIVLLGLQHAQEEVQRRSLGGETAGDFCGRLISRLDRVDNVGDVALTCWAAAELGHPEIEVGLERLHALSGAERDLYTVEAAWVLTALVAAHERGLEQKLIDRARDRILAVSSGSGIFPHWTNLAKAPWIRSHVSCFADQVYPIQSLARYHRCFGHEASLRAANRCAEQICRLQGQGGQWWWHYDARSGEVVEGYPVYSVHQDAMGPMALLDLEEAGGDGHCDSIRLGLEWMARAPEIDCSLIDDERTLIWRKVVRAEPNKLSRKLRAAASRLVPSLRFEFLDGFLPPRRIDWECRPYHLGWVLYAWLQK